MIQKVLGLNREHNSTSVLFPQFIKTYKTAIQKYYQVLNLINLRFYSSSSVVSFSHDQYCCNPSVPSNLLYGILISAAPFYGFCDYLMSRFIAISCRHRPSSSEPETNKSMKLRQATLPQTYITLPTPQGNITLICCL